MKNFLIDIKTVGNEELGYLSFFEANIDISFNIKRIYYISKVKAGIKRGMHAHKSLQQLLWCPSGKIEVVLDDGTEKVEYALDSPEKALLVPRGYWHDMHWRQDNSVLCVAASDYYSEDDYIRNYDEFLKYVERGYWNNENKL